MIQRIQSIYLLTASLLSGAFPVSLSLWVQIEKNSPVYALDLFSGKSVIETLIPSCFLISALISILVIFLFKHRKLQLKLGRVIILINLFLLGLLIYLSLTLSGEAAVSKKGIGMLIPVFTILLIILANRAIKKDEDLVKSVDRLR